MQRTIFESNTEEDSITDHFKYAYLCFLFSFIILLIFSSAHQTALHQADLARNHTWQVSSQHIDSSNEAYIRRERVGASLILPTSHNNALVLQCDVKLMKLCQQELKQPTQAIQTIYYYQTLPRQNNSPEYQLKAIDYLDLKGNLIHLNYNKIAPNDPIAMQKHNWKLWIITFMGAWLCLLIVFMISTLLKICSKKIKVTLIALLGFYYISSLYESLIIYIS